MTVKRNWADIAERAATMAVTAFVASWAALDFHWTAQTFKAAAIGAVVSLAKNLVGQGHITQTPQHPLPQEERVET